MDYLLAIDQGTSSTRALVFDKDGKTCGLAQKPIQQYYPNDGWVEHCAEEIWQKTLDVVSRALTKAKLEAKQIKALGITNQRETTVVWNKETGKPIAKAIVWQDRRTAEECSRRAELNDEVQSRTGLVLDAYFSATKLKWLLEHVDDAKSLAKRGLLAFGTIDSFLIWRLTNGKVHATDITNASRTMLFNINRQTWDDELLKVFDVPASILPRVKACDDDFGVVDKSYFGESIPITGVAGDQQAATVGQACFQKGMAKVTYGTGAFLLLNTGEKRVYSNNSLLSTVAYKVGNTLHYGLEGCIFNAGTVVKWLRDTLEIINCASETEAIASCLSDNGGVYLVPAFTGLGAPYWQPDARASILGLKLNSDRRYIVRAALESVAYQTRDLIAAMMADCGGALNELRVDGGMADNQWFLAYVANCCQLLVKKPTCIESTARGAALLAGLGVGMYSSFEDMAKTWHQSVVFEAEKDHELTDKAYRAWQLAVKSTQSFVINSRE